MIGSLIHVPRPSANMGTRLSARVHAVRSRQLYIVSLVAVCSPTAGVVTEVLLCAVCVFVFGH